ncbi:DDE-type integrase/transposase/recombinase [Candidatus Saccharibacteria bacterium]|nr:DDE-type integrase/transposase/recombinase [Candidatus Saccharibacteria bacterium]
MSYCTGKNIEKSRGKAMKMLVIEKKPVGVVADRFGVHRSTIWRWRQKWLMQNSHIELENPVRRKYLGVSAYKYNLCKWNIPSFSAAPKHPHTLSDSLIQLVLDVRDQLKRYAEVVWYHINSVLCIRISLSSVRRILKRYGRMKKPKHHKNRRYKGIPRPQVLAPGDLVEIDTIHLFNPVSKQKRYIYTVIDLYTRMAYARIYKELKPINSLNTILEAEQYFGFKFKMVQSDNGLEFARYFETRLESKGIKIRHTRLGRPNDNAHIERFNRTLQEECTGNYYLESEPLKQMNDKILSYIDFYNYHRIHLSISYRTPAEMLHRL